MMLSFFDQFESTILFGIPLIALAMTLPFILFPGPQGRWVVNRLLGVQTWSLNRCSAEVLLPVKPSGHKWALLFMSLFLFLVMMNVPGILPYTFTPTTQLSLNLGLAVPLWLGTVIVGMRNQPNLSLAHLLPEGTPTALIPVLIIIETISLFIRPLALGVRLTANLTAGHLLMQLIAKATFVFMSIMPSIAVATGLLLLMLVILETAVAMIQAYVFILLLSLYLQENL
uniref:ATP synthase subunit a n=1 Tax=Grammatobothus polyophthalmus TaxID=1609333 RepID=A0A5J6DWE0_9PLEU|nr:ATP synthase F0 subunit 6 [Grammatobothus polyophthalmus]QES95365.1 ATP synthase F0 subunit 6 [Grammatobothus polyophthalmus]